MMHKIIDPHLHFFDLDLGQYFWLTQGAGPNWPNLNLIRQNHGVQNLHNSHFHINGLVHIEAGFNNDDPSKELAWLANSLPNNLAYKAIGYLDITQSNETFEQGVNSLLGQPNFIGIRDITEGEDTKRLFSKHVECNIASLNHHGLIFEAQFEVANLPACQRIAQLAQQSPKMQFVINHAGFISARDNVTDNLKLLAEQTNIAIKISGEEHCEYPLEPSQKLKLLLELFDSERVMFASNYPVCLMRASYEEVWQSYARLVEDEALWRKLSHDNAKRIYRLT